MAHEEPHLQQTSSDNTGSSFNVNSRPAKIPKTPVDEEQQEFCLPGTLNYNDFMRQYGSQLTMNDFEQMDQQPRLSMEPTPSNEKLSSDEQEEKDIYEGLMDNKTFHGMVPMEDLKGLLKTNGDYLIRSDEASKETVVSVFWQGEIKHCPIKSKPKLGASFYPNNYKPTILELIEDHRKKRMPVSQNNAILYKPVLRQPWELRRNAIKVTTKLGEGAFGEVFKGTLKIRTTGRVVDVAIKQPKTKNASADAVNEAMKEARIQKEYTHHNIVRLYGVSAETLPIMIVLEFVDGGSLDAYMKKNHKTLGPKHRGMICFDVSYGLSYLHSNGCIHRDMAARNCLVSNKYGIVKISDFGLSSVGSSQAMEKNKPVPIRWLAPDVLKTMCFNKTSDIWALGIVYWEVFTNCLELPYENLSLGEVQKKLCNEQPFHPEMPACTPADVRSLALKCWNPSPAGRPTAEQCTNALLEYAQKERYKRIPDLGKAKGSVKKSRKNIIKRKTSSKESAKAVRSSKGSKLSASSKESARSKGKPKSSSTDKKQSGSSSKDSTKSKGTHDSSKKKITHDSSIKSSKKSRPRSRKS